MKIVINGKEKECSEQTTLQELLNSLSLDGKVMAAAVNMNIIKQESWNSHVLNDGDKLELLDFVGGG